MPLKIITKTVHEIDYSDLENLISETYNHEIEIPCDLETSNDCSRTVFLAKRPLRPYEIDKLNKFKDEGSYSYSTYTIMQDLCNNDLIPEGDYVINISW